MSFLKKLLGNNDYEYEEDAIVEESAPETSGVVSSSAKSDAKKPEFVLVKPADRDELGAIANNLMGGKTVVLNLELVTKDSKRFVDFLSGAVYALDGNIQKVSNGIFLIAPYNVGIMSGDFKDELKNKIVFPFSN